MKCLGISLSAPSSAQQQQKKLVVRHPSSSSSSFFFFLCHFFTARLPENGWRLWVIFPCHVERFSAKSASTGRKINVLARHTYTQARVWATPLSQSSDWACFSRKMGFSTVEIAAAAWLVDFSKSRPLLLLEMRELSQSPEGVYSAWWVSWKVWTLSGWLFDRTDYTIVGIIWCKGSGILILIKISQFCKHY